MFIRSERLFLRPAWPEDWQELFSRIADEAVVRNLARAPWPYTTEDARWFASQPQDQRCPHFFVTLPTGGARLLQSLPGRRKPALLLRADTSNAYLASHPDAQYDMGLSDVVLRALRDGGIFAEQFAQPVSRLLGEVDLLLKVSESRLVGCG